MSEVFSWREAPIAEFAVIGSPIAHSLSPQMHQAAFEACGISSSYVAIEVKPGEVFDALDRLAEMGYKGVNVTVPHKEDAFEWCWQTTDVATRLKVCNTLDMRNRMGTNTDVEGFARSLDVLKSKNRRVLVLGAGGSSRAVLEALQSDGWKISLWNRTPKRAFDLINEFGFQAERVEVPTLMGYGLIVNTTSASLTGDKLPIDWGESEKGVIAYDLAYGNGLTPFLDDAQRRGFTVMDGRRMLMEQGAAAFEFWWKRPAPRDEMLAALG